MVSLTSADSGRGVIGQNWSSSGFRLALSPVSPSIRSNRSEGQKHTPCDWWDKRSAELTDAQTSDRGPQRRRTIRFWCFLKPSTAQYPAIELFEVRRNVLLILS